MKKVFLAGEGRNDLGGWARMPPDHDPDEDGAITALLKALVPTGWEVVDAIRWKDIRKFRSGERGSAEVRNVLVAARMAALRKYDALVFMRDRDRQRSRADAIEQGIQEAHAMGLQISIAGGVAIERLEAWLLAIHGEHLSERPAKPEEHPIARGLPTTAHMVDAIATHGITKVPADAASLHTWMARVRAALT